MPNATRCSYKGCSITTRCTAVRSTTEGLESDPLSRGSTARFTASFSVDLNSANAESWQQFLKTDFDSFAHATENALATAKRSIDLRLAA